MFKLVANVILIYTCMCCIDLTYKNHPLYVNQHCSHPHSAMINAMTIAMIIAIMNIFNECD